MVLAAAAGIGAATVGVRPAAAATTRASTTRPATVRASNARGARHRPGPRGFLDAALDAYATSGPRLPQSYADQVGLHDTGFTYDAALAVLAYLAECAPDRAQAIGAGLLAAQAKDSAGDGRLRQAYGVRALDPGGPFGFTASYTGDQAWAGIALVALYERLGDRRALAGAVRLGAWVLEHCTSTGALGGFRAGVGRDGTTPAPYLTTAHNADLVALFGLLAAHTGEQRWLAARDSAACFVCAMYRPDARHFASGSPDGRGADPGAVSLEAQTHAWLALRDPGTFPCLGWVGEALAVTDTPARPNSTVPSGHRFRGVTVTTASRYADPGTPIEPGLPGPDPQGVWLEGTAQYACALANGFVADDADHLATLRTAQSALGSGQTLAGRTLPDGAGLVAATSPVSVGVEASGYYPARGVAPTAWYVFALRGVNPLC